MRHHATALFAWVTCLLLGAAFAEAATPNVVIIFADDQGYHDVGCYGSDIPTPHLDRLASQGMRFTQFYVSQAVCSASRAALMTGCYSNRIGILGALGPNSKHGLHPGELTLAELLKQKGYATAVFGKWHLGHLEPHLPKRHGFDEYSGLPYSNDMWPHHPQRPKAFPQLWYYDNDGPVRPINNLKEQEELTTLFTEKAVDFIERNKDRPFFLYLPHAMPHVPLAVSDKHKGKSGQGVYGDVIMEIDWSVGQVLAALEKHGLTDNTVVLYTSDNGPWLTYGNHAGSAFPLREGKGTMWEGGCRVPAILRWPGHVKPNTVCDKMAATIDVLPTLAAIVDGELPAHKIDGVNLLPLLKSEPDANPRSEYYFYYGHQLQAVRRGDWKLHLPHEYLSYEGFKPGADGQPGPYGRGRTGYELYNVSKHPREFVNEADRHPQLVEELKALAERARAELGDHKRKGAGQREPGRVTR